MALCRANDYHPVQPDIDWDNISLGEIAGEPLILYEKDNPVRRGIDRVFSRNDLKCNIIIETGGPEILLEYARIGMGITIVSGLPLHYKSQAEITAIPVTHYFGKLGYGIIYRKDKYLSPPLLDFLTILDPQIIIDGEISADS